MTTEHNKLTEQPIMDAINALFKEFVDKAAALTGEQALHVGACVFTLKTDLTAHDECLMLSSFGNDPEGMMQVAHRFRDFAIQGMMGTGGLAEMLEQAFGGKPVDIGLDGVQAIELPPLGEPNQ